ncbi:hypothetical protein KNE206_78860 [Kitasatospora sp. NE20-6]
MSVTVPQAVPAGTGVGAGRGNKLWSLDKLTQVADLGHLALWLRWSRSPVPVPIPSAVCIVRAHVLRRTTANHQNRYMLQPDN